MYAHVLSLVFVSSNYCQVSSGLCEHCPSFNPLLFQQTPLNGLLAQNNPFTQLMLRTANCFQGRSLCLSQWSLNCVVPYSQLFAQPTHPGLPFHCPTPSLTICFIKLLSIGFPLQPFHPYANPSHSHLSHQTLLNRLLTPAYPPMRNPLSHIKFCFIQLLSIGFSLQPIPPMPNPLTHICLIQLLSRGFSPQPTLPLPNLQLSFIQSTMLIDLPTSVAVVNQLSMCKLSITFMCKCNLPLLISTGKFGLLHQQQWHLLPALPAITWASFRTSVCQ